jgi:predicted ester cyclase
VGESQRGAAAARDNVIAFFLAALPDLAWKMVGEPVVTGDTAAFRWVFEGTNTGAPFFEGAPATGARVALQGMTMIKVKSGKIVYQGDFYDALTLKKQLGLPG